MLKFTSAFSKYLHASHLQNLRCTVFFVKFFHCMFQKWNNSLHQWSYLLMWAVCCWTSVRSWDCAGSWHCSLPGRWLRRDSRASATLRKFSFSVMASWRSSLFLCWLAHSDRIYRGETLLNHSSTFWYITALLHGIFDMTPEIEHRCILFPLIILEILLQLD